MRRFTAGVGALRFNIYHPFTPTTGLARHQGRKGQVSVMRRTSSILSAVAAIMLLTVSFAFITSMVNDSDADAGTGLGAPTDFTGYIPVSSPGDLAKVGTGIPAPSDHNGITYNWLLSDRYYLVNDITLTGIDNHTPIGYRDVDFDLFLFIEVDNSEPFTGIFDGNGFTISGMNINMADKQVGLFGYTVGAQIRNLTVAAGTVKSRYVAAYEAPNTGGIVGYASGTVIENCHNTGVAVTSDKHAGGIVGLAYAQSTMIGCSNTAAAASMVGDGYAAGIAGHVEPNGSNVTITDCYNTGNMSGGMGAAGVIGSIAAVGSQLTITDCYNTGTISTVSWAAGGVVGFMYTEGSQLKMEGCHNTGDVSGIESAGGIVGMAYSYVSSAVTIEGCYNAGAVSAVNSSAGGILGFLMQDSSHMLITKSYNTGTASVPFVAAGAGGILGGMQSYGASQADIENCYNTGDIGGGFAGAGGMAGFLYLDGAGAAVTNCYSIGTIVGPPGATGGAVGSANSLGSDEAKVFCCFFLAGTAPSVGGSASTALVIDSVSREVTEDEMRPDLTDAKEGNSIFTSGGAAWDFGSIWTIVPGENDGYPMLRIFFPPEKTELPPLPPGPDPEPRKPSAPWPWVVIAFAALTGFLIFLDDDDADDEKKKKPKD